MTTPSLSLDLPVNPAQNSVGFPGRISNHRFPRKVREFLNLRQLSCCQDRDCYETRPMITSEEFYRITGEKPTHQDKSLGTKDQITSG